MRSTEKVTTFTSMTVEPELSIENNYFSTRKQEIDHKTEHRLQVVWLNTIIFLIINIITLFGTYEFYIACSWSTFCYMWVLVAISGLGITAGAHRLWAHKCYKARAPLRILLTVFNLTAFQNSIYEWVRDHRVHHKFTDTDADPHNSTRGFFFSHMGWLMVKKHPEVKRKGKLIDMSDLEKDPIVMFQHKYYFYLMPWFAFVIPAVIPIYFCGTDPWYAFYMYSITRWSHVLHGTWSVNSFAHLVGYKPYDAFISATQNVWVSFFVLGEGWHNYHHVFPWDYKTSEFPYYINFTTAFIDLCARIGWAYDLKTVKQEVINSRALRTGNGSHESFKSVETNNNIWGWDDDEITEKHREMASIKFCAQI